MKIKKPKTKLMRGHSQNVNANEHTKEVCPHCGKCYMNYDYDGSYLNWECKTFP